MSQSYVRPLPVQKDKKGHPCLFGCLTLVVVVCLLAVVGGVGAYFFVRNALDAYTDTKPEELPQVTVNPAESQQLWARLKEFKAAADAGTQSTLTLSENELNVLFRTNPSSGPFGNAVYFILDGDTVKGKVSLPLAQFGLPGRFVNGSGAFSMAIKDGKLETYLQELTVKGKPLAETMMEKLRTTNLAQDMGNDPQLRKVLGQVESLAVENSEIKITLKGSAK